MIQIIGTSSVRKLSSRFAISTSGSHFSACIQSYMYATYTYLTKYVRLLIAFAVYVFHFRKNTRIFHHEWFKSFFLGDNFILGGLYDPRTKRISQKSSSDGTHCRLHTHFEASSSSWKRRRRTRDLPDDDLFAYNRQNKFISTCAEKPLFFQQIFPPPPLAIKNQEATKKAGNLEVVKSREERDRQERNRNV